MQKGLVYVFTGDGKGKTSAALGTAMRAVGNGMRVAWVAWYKQASWRMSEVDSLKKLAIPVYFEGKGFYLKDSKQKKERVGAGGLVVDTATEQEHQSAALVALGLAKKLVKEVDVLVLDEVNNAVNDGLVGVEGLLQLIEMRDKTHVILTGRAPHPKILEIADLVTEMKQIKHPYDLGALAVKGLDF